MANNQATSTRRISSSVPAQGNTPKGGGYTGSMQQTSSSPIPAPMAEIPAQLEHLAVNSNELSNAISRLEERLYNSGVCRDAPINGETAEGPSIGPATAMARNIQQQALTLNHFAYRIQEMLNRIEV